MVLLENKAASYATVLLYLCLQYQRQALKKKVSICFEEISTPSSMINQKPGKNIVPKTKPWPWDLGHSDKKESGCRRKSIEYQVQWPGKWKKKEAVLVSAQILTDPSSCAGPKAVAARAGLGSGIKWLFG